MKRRNAVIIAVSVTICAAVLLPHAFGQNNQGAPPTRVAVCDVVHIFGEYEKAQNIIAELEAKRQSIERENNQRQQQMANLQAELESYRPGSEQFAKTRDQIERLAIEHQAWLEYQRAITMRKHHQRTRDIYDEILKKVRQVAEHSGYDLVLFRSQEAVMPTQSTSELLEEIERRQVLYASPRIDITDVVLDGLNAGYEAARDR